MRTRVLLPALLLCIALRADAAPVPRPPWALPVHQVTESQPLTSFPTDYVWETGSWPGTSIEIPRAGREITIRTRVDSAAAPATYLTGCLPSPRNWSAYDGLRLTVTTDRTRRIEPITLRVIVNEETQIKLSALPAPSGITRTIVLPFPKDKRKALERVEKVQFLWVAREFNDGETIRLTVRNLELVGLRETLTHIPSTGLGLELLLGDGERVPIIKAGAAPTGKIVIHTGGKCILYPEDRITYTFTNMLGDTKTVSRQVIGRPVSGSSRVELDCTLPGVPQGYYWLTADIIRNGKSLTGGRVGFADLCSRGPTQSMTEAMLGLRAGMGRYTIDPIGGFGSGGVALMPTYDPRDATHYRDFIKAYQAWSKLGASTHKDTEVLEAGVTGAVFAACAYRATGNQGGRKCAEYLIKNNCDYMIRFMQNADGSTKWDVNEYFMRNLGDYRDTVTEARVPDTNQVGEWLKAISRAIIYFREDPAQKAYVDKLYRAACRSAAYLIRCSTQASGKHQNVIRHFKILDPASPMSRRWLYIENGTQCDVYAPRAMAGLSYFAYASQALGKPVPAEYLNALRDTTAWSLEKMKPDTGWFDWQCGYEAEGGCHAYLGNMYLAEAAQGYYLVCAARGDKENAKLAAECARRALRFVTDHDRTTGIYKGDYPMEFWVGPYLYWQFSEYLGSIGDEPAFHAYLGYLHRGWAEKRGWQEFTQRTGNSRYHRANSLDPLTMAVLAYPALKLMEEQGKPFRYPVPTLRELE